MEGKEHTYTNGEVTIVWKKELCMHSTRCFRGLPSVFKPAQRPWVDVGGATTGEMIAQVKKCPSGALSYRMNDEGSRLPPVEGEVR